MSSIITAAPLVSTAALIRKTIAQRSIVVGVALRAFGTATADGYERALLSATGAVARWHEQLRLRHEQPHLAEHLGIRQEAERVVRKLSSIGYGHPKCEEWVAAGSAVLMVLRQSVPSNAPANEAALTEAVGRQLEFELRRLATERPSQP